MRAAFSVASNAETSGKPGLRAKATAYGDRPLPPLDPAQLLREAEHYVEAVANLIGS